MRSELDLNVIIFFAPFQTSGFRVHCVLIGLFECIGREVNKQPDILGKPWLALKANSVALITVKMEKILLKSKVTGLEYLALSLTPKLCQRMESDAMRHTYSPKTNINTNSKNILMRNTEQKSIATTGLESQQVCIGWKFIFHSRETMEEDACVIILH